MPGGGLRTRVCSSRWAVSSQAMTIRGATAATIPANAWNHSIVVASAGRCPTLPTKRLFSASVFFGVRSETANPALASRSGTRAVPIQRGEVESSNAEVAMAEMIDQVTESGQGAVEDWRRLALTPPPGAPDRSIEIRTGPGQLLGEHVHPDVLSPSLR